MTSLKKVDNLSDFLDNILYNLGSYFQYQGNIYRIPINALDYFEAGGLPFKYNLIESKNPIDKLLEHNLIEKVENFTEDMLIHDIHAYRNEILIAVSMFELEDLAQVVRLIRTIMKTPIKYVNWDEKNLCI